MKAITVQPPWSQAIADGHKVIENRKAAPAWRGEFFVHAGARWSPRGAEFRHLADIYERETISRRRVVDPAFFTFGAVVAVATLVDAHPAGGCCRPWGEDQCEEHPSGRVVRPVHLVLEDIRKIPEPVPCRGALPLGWTVPPDVEALVLHQLRESS